MSLADSIFEAFSSDKKSLNVFRGDETDFGVEFLQTGIASIDFVLNGGFPYGRSVELYGNFSSGKTYLLYLALAANQRAGGLSILFEAEGAFDAEFYAKCGGDPTTLLLIPVRCVEDVFDMVIKLCKRIKQDRESLAEKVCIGWDSIAMTGTRHLQDVGMEKVDMSKAGKMSQGCQLVTDEIADTKICFIATNQVREKIGSKDSSTHTPGGNAWGFFSSQRLELRFDGGSKTSLINEVVRGGGKAAEGDPLGRWVKVMCTKNKCGPPLLTCSLPFYNFAGYEHPVFGYGTTEGIDRCEALFDFYLNSRFYVVSTVTSKERAVQTPSTGWYALHPQIDPTQKKFRQADWPSVLQANSILWNLPYLSKSIPATTDVVTNGVGDQSAATSGTIPAAAATV